MNPKKLAVLGGAGCVFLTGVMAILSVGPRPMFVAGLSAVFMGLVAIAIAIDTHR